MRQTARSAEEAGGHPERTATHLVTELTGELRRHEDAETAIQVYKMANWIIGQMEEVKAKARQLAEADMEQRGLDELDTPTGSAGWTEPQVRQLDEEAWARAMGRNPRLMELQREFEEAEAALEQAREPFKELPEPRFYIR
jgi:hypothetical protein